jgi:Tfp pilus assembly protein PilO
VAVGVLGHAYLLEPLLGRRDRVEQLIEAREAVLARQERLVARRARYEEEDQQLRAEIQARRARLLPGDRPPLAASELQKLVKSTAQDTGVEVRSERILPTVDRSGYTEVPVEVTLSGPIRALVGFFHRLDAAPVLLSLQDVKIRVVSVGAPRELLATLTLAGYIGAGGEVPPASGRGEPPRRPGA